MVTDAAAWMVARLKSLSAFAALEGRIFPDMAKEGTANPCLVYQLIGDEHEAVMDAGPTGHGTLAFQVRIYANGRLQASRLRDAFREAFEGLEPVAVSDGWRLEGSGFGDLADTIDGKDYGAIGVIELHVARR